MSRVYNQVSFVKPAKDVVTWDKTLIWNMLLAVWSKFVFRKQKMFALLKMWSTEIVYWLGTSSLIFCRKKQKLFVQLTVFTFSKVKTTMFFFFFTKIGPTPMSIKQVSFLFQETRSFGSNFQEVLREWCSKRISFMTVILPF